MNVLGVGNTTAEPPVAPPLPTMQRDAFARRLVSAPDILLIESLRLVPKAPYKVEPIEVLEIEVTDTLPGQDFKCLYMITPDGAIELGRPYGTVRVGLAVLLMSSSSCECHSLTGPL